MKFHPLSEQYAYLTGAEWGAFVESIRASNGNRQSIKYRVLENGDHQGLDGRNRLKACAQLGIDAFLERVFCPDSEVASFIVDCNERRRHTSPETRAQLALALSEEGKSSRQIAAKLGVSQPTVLRDLKSLEPADTNVSRDPGDEDDAELPHIKPNGRPARREPLGADVLDWDKYSGALGVLMSLIVRLAKLYHFQNSPDEKALGRKLNEFSLAFRHAYRKYSKIDPPRDPREAP